MSERQETYAVDVFFAHVRDDEAKERTWSRIGRQVSQHVEDEISDDDSATVQRAADLLTLAEAATKGYVVMGQDREGFFVEVKHGRGWKRCRGDNAIAEAAAFVRGQR